MKIKKIILTNLRFIAHSNNETPKCYNCQAPLKPGLEQATGVCMHCVRSH